MSSAAVATIQMPLYIVYGELLQNFQYFNMHVRRNRSKVLITISVPFARFPLNDFISRKCFVRHLASFALDFLVAVLLPISDDTIKKLKKYIFFVATPPRPSQDRAGRWCSNYNFHRHRAMKHHSFAFFLGFVFLYFFVGDGTAINAQVTNWKFMIWKCVVRAFHSPRVSMQ